MALTQLADLIEPSVFKDYIALRTTELSALFQSGIVVPDPEIDELASSKGKTFNMPFFNDLASDEANVGTDTTGTATPKKITASQDVSVKHIKNQGWSSADINLAIVGEDPMIVIGDRVAGYWSRVLQKSLISSIRGVIADNVANDSSDMVYTIANDLASAVTAAEKISANAVIQAKATMGDATGQLAAIAMHSVVYHTLLDLDVITFIKPSDPSLAAIPTYMGMQVIVDDGLPAIAGTNRITYHTYLFGRASVGWGEGDPRVPVEVEREAAQGNGEGVETLWSRRHYILHPRGVKFTNSSVAGNSPTDTELLNAANWDRVYDRKLIRVACLQTNG
jgi:hypothetical protein